MSPRKQMIIRVEKLQEIADYLDDMLKNYDDTGMDFEIPETQIEKWAEEITGEEND